MIRAFGVRDQAGVRRGRRERRFSWRQSCALSLLWLAACGPAEEISPNILLISIDTLRQDHLSGCGYPRGTSPFMDRLAAEGVLFMNGMSTTSWTLPSHCSLMTGQYAASHGVCTVYNKLSTEKTTLAEILAAAGYDTIGFYSTTFVSAGYGLSQGFRAYERHGRDFDQEARLIWERKFGREQAPRCVSSAPGLAVRVREWLQEQWGGEPFFMFVHTFDPHWAYRPQPVYESYFGGRARPSFTEWTEPPPKDVPRDLSGDAKRDLLDYYDSEIRLVDRSLQDLLAAFEEASILDRTLVVLAADHGEEFLEHGNVEHSRTLYEESLRVPMILRLPGVFEGGHVVTQPVSLVDVFPTVLRLLALEEGGAVQGVALQEVLAGPVERHGVVAELRMKYVSFRESDWKLILNLKRGEKELYSLCEDPGERENLASSRPEVLQRLEEELADAQRGRFAESDSASVPELDAERQNELRALGYVQ
jgi:arylsulfatase A-like enzyme